MNILRKSCGGEDQRAAGLGVDQGAVGEGGVECVADRTWTDSAVLGAESALEQPWGRRRPDALGAVVGGDDGDRRGGGADPTDDGGKHVGQFRADDQQPLGVGLGRRDLEQGDEFAGAGQVVLHEAVVSDLQEFLDPHSGGSQDLDRGPGPEREVFLHRQVPPSAAGGVIDPHPVGGARGDRAGEALSGDGEAIPGHGSAGGLQEHVGALALLVDGAHQGWKDGQPPAGAGVHA